MSDRAVFKVQLRVVSGWARAAVSCSHAHIPVAADMALGELGPWIVDHLKEYHEAVA